MKVLSRPGRSLDINRAAEPVAVRINLGGVREQRLVTDLEELAARHPGRYLRLVLARAVRPVLQPLRIRRLEATALQLLMQRREPGLVEGGEVVKLERLPGLPAASVAIGIGGCLECPHCDLVSLDVIGMRIGARLDRKSKTLD